MGTRADFYIGTDENAEWLGSVAYDGYQWEDEPAGALMLADTEEKFREAVAEALRANVDNATTPDMGWPWPWEDSTLTDYAYCYSGGTGGSVTVYMGGRISEGRDEDGDPLYGEKRTNWPNMKSHQNVTFGPRSGLLVVG